MSDNAETRAYWRDLARQVERDRWAPLRWGTWSCPECEREHYDPEGQDTHCGGCGLIVNTGPLDPVPSPILVDGKRFYVPLEDQS